MTPMVATTPLYIPIPILYLYPLLPYYYPILYYSYILYQYTLLNLSSNLEYASLEVPAFENCLYFDSNNCYSYR
jgi:hypothetical protein